MKQHLVLVGLPGSGKTTVGQLLASRLGVPFVDADDEIVRAAGKPVSRIFQEDGEQRFRALESACIDVLVSREPVSVIAPGGGWAAQPGNMDRVRNKVYCVYLQTSPETAAARIAGQDSGVSTRPLVEAGLEQSGVAALLMNREPAYLRADVSVSTDDRSPEQVVEEILQLARIRGPV